MLAKCANPECEAQFHYLGEGQLYCVQPPRGHDGNAEYFWMCDECAAEEGLELRESGIVPITTRPRTAA